VIYLRQACSQNVLPEMLEVNPTSIGKAIAEPRNCWTSRTAPSKRPRCAYHHPGTHQLPGRWRHGNRPPRAPRARALSDPSLTGMTRAELTTLARRLSVPQATRIERLRHQRHAAAGNAVTIEATGTYRNRSEVIIS
jgi:hypothetical protein